jgi:hypothetical protein
MPDILGLPRPSCGVSSDPLQSRHHPVVHQPCPCSHPEHRLWLSQAGTFSCGRCSQGDQSLSLTVVVEGWSDHFDE